MKDMKKLRPSILILTGLLLALAGCVVRGGGGGGPWYHDGPWMNGGPRVAVGVDIHPPGYRR